MEIIEIVTWIKCNNKSSEQRKNVCRYSLVLINHDNYNTNGLTIKTLHTDAYRGGTMIPNVRSSME